MLHEDRLPTSLQDDDRCVTIEDFIKIQDSILGIMNKNYIIHDEENNILLTFSYSDICLKQFVLLQKIDDKITLIENNGYMIKISKTCSIRIINEILKAQHILKEIKKNIENIQNDSKIICFSKTLYQEWIASDARTLEINKDIKCDGLYEVFNTKALTILSDIGYKTDRFVFTLSSASDVQLELSDELNKTQIKRIRLVIFKNIAEYVFVELAFANSNEKKFYVFENLYDVKWFYDQLIKQKTVAEIFEDHASLFESRIKGSENDIILNNQWKESPIDFFYGSGNSKPREEYKVRFEMIWSQLLQIITTKRHGNILFISPACGIADDLIFFYKKLENFNAIVISENRITTKWAGLEINTESTEIAKKRFPEGYFANLSLDEMPLFFDTMNNQFKEFNNDLKIILFSGVLAKDVSFNSLKALQYYQCALREIKPGDLIIITSLTYSILSKRIAKAAGSTIIHMATDFANSSKRLVLFYSKETPEKRVEFILNQSAKRKKLGMHVLDLSYSADPIADLKLLEIHASDKLNEIQELDLSWSYIKSLEEAKTLINLIDKYKFPNIIIAENDRFLKQLLSAERKILRLDNPNENSPPYASIKFNKNFFNSFVNDVPIDENSLFSAKRIFPPNNENTISQRVNKKLKKN